MFDIAKCEDDECPRANNCWRFTSPPNQIEWIITPERDEDGCDMYWPATYHPDPENVLASHLPPRPREREIPASHR